MTPRLDSEAFRKLAPEEKINVLKQLKEEIAEEIKKSEEHSQHSIEEIELMMREIEDEQAAFERIVIPKSKTVRVEELFSRNSNDDDDKLERLVTQDNEKQPEETPVLRRQDDEQYDRSAEKQEERGYQSGGDEMTYSRLRDEERQRDYLRKMDEKRRREERHDSYKQYEKSIEMKEDDNKEYFRAMRHGEVVDTNKAYK